MDKENVEVVPKEEEEYEVERIVGHKIVKIKNAKVTFNSLCFLYLLKGYFRQLNILSNG